jgi:hypothetical protein
LKVKDCLTLFGVALAVSSLWLMYNDRLGCGLFGGMKRKRFGLFLCSHQPNRANGPVRGCSSG